MAVDYVSFFIETHDLLYLHSLRLNLIADVHYSNVCQLIPGVVKWGQHACLPAVLQEWAQSWQGY